MDETLARLTTTVCRSLSLSADYLNCYNGFVMPYLLQELAVHRWLHTACQLTALFPNQAHLSYQLLLTVRSR